jgi:NADH dehydrogenase
MTAATSDHKRPRIAILGGGFGGLHAALRLNQLDWGDYHPEITLVDRGDRFVFLPLLYELMTGELQSWEVAPPFSELLAGTRVRFVQATVEAIDLDARQVTLGGPSATTLGYDWLVLALGCETPLDWVPGAADHAFPFRSIADVYRLEERLRVLEATDCEKIRIAVVGGGYSGVELACKLADRLQSRGRLRLIEQSDRILRNSPNFNRQAADRALEERGIWIDWETSVRDIGSDRLMMDYRGRLEEIPVDAVVWTVGNRVPELVRSLPLAKNSGDRLLVQPTLQVVDRPEVFALGDIAEMRNGRDAAAEPVPSTGQAALQAGDYVGWNLWASVLDRPLLPFRYQHLGEMLALGNTSATLTGLGVQLDGPLAYVARRLVYLYRMPTLEHQLKVGLNWMAKPLLDRLADLNRPSR